MLLLILSVIAFFAGIVFMCREGNIILIYLIIFGFFGILGFSLSWNKAVNQSLLTTTNYIRLNKQVEFVAKTDSIPFELKKSIYTECVSFNKTLAKTNKYKHNIFIGLYQDRADPDVSFLDLTNFK